MTHRPMTTASPGPSIGLTGPCPRSTQAVATITFEYDTDPDSDVGGRGWTAVAALR